MHRIRNGVLAGALAAGTLGLGVVVAALGPAGRTASLVDAAQRVNLSGAGTSPSLPADAGRSAPASRTERGPAAVADSIVLLRPPSTRSVTTTPPVVTAPDALAEAEAAARACVGSARSPGC